MRILASAKPIPLDKLGLSSAQPRSALKHAVERPYGLVLCVGPTGSGKTTTLHSALGHINMPERKIWTAEDPVEITQPGLRQVQVNPKIDWTFAKALRAFLRADPDVIMVGEMRDKETAQMAIEASLTGHLVLSHAAHQQRARDGHAPARHGHGPVQLRRLAARRAGAAPGAPAVPALPHEPRRRRTTRSTSCWPTTCTPSAPTPPVGARRACSPAGRERYGRDGRLHDAHAAPAASSATTPASRAAPACTS